MDILIKEKLKEIEASNGVRILYACESGSRAWGFPSPDSDYDVRFIYAHDLDWHLSLRDKKDTIDLPINDLLDIGGWEVKKALGLLWKSNAPLLEWIQSPIVYYSDDEFLITIQDLSPDFFSSIAVMHHYLSMSKKYFESCLGSEKVKLKKYFYALRTAIAGKWILEKGTIPHITLSEMLGIVESHTRARIFELINIKAVQSEDYLHPKEPLINDFLKETIFQNEAVANDLTSAEGDFQKLDEFYRKVIKGGSI